MGEPVRGRRQHRQGLKVVFWLSGCTRGSKYALLGQPMGMALSLFIVWRQRCRLVCLLNTASCRTAALVTPLPGMASTQHVK